ncbi:MAG: oxidoreductase [Oscillospiraceae bacterium]|nr:oxidoreductase [Oscillospiraceae bacterium]
MKKVVIITGASSGIGKAIARELLEDGRYKVYALSRRLRSMEDLGSLGAVTMKLDITDEYAAQRTVRDIYKAEKRIDILINNAGYGSYGAIEDVELSEARRQFEVNLFGMASMLRAVLPYMRTQRRGLIINMSSISGRIHTLLGGWYHASKHAVEGLSDCLRNETRRFGIDVVILEPGMINTSWAKIAAQRALKTSGHTAYRDLAHASYKFFSKYRYSSSAERVAKKTLAIIEEPYPKARYTVPFYWMPLLGIRFLMGDERVDRIMERVFGVV